MKRRTGTFRRIALFYRLLLLLMISVSLPVLLLGYLSYERSKEQIEQVAHQFLADNVNQNAQRLERLWRDVEKRSEGVIGSTALQDLLKSPPPKLVTGELEFIQLMNDLIAELKGAYELYIFPIAYDRYPNYSNLLQYKQVIPSEEMFAKAAELKGQGYWTHEWNGQWKAPDFMFVRQIRTLDDLTPVGVMVIRVPHFMIREELIGPSQYPRAQLILTDADGKVLAHPDASAYGSDAKASAGGDDDVQAELKLSVRDWILSIRLPKEDVTATLEGVKRFTIWIVSVSLLMIALLLVLVARSFTNPIKQIIHYMKMVRLGQLKPMPAHERHDEIGQWMNGYNAMIDSLLEQMDATRRMEREKRDLERQMLILQINPHFLYNTLDSIKWKAQAMDEPVISEMVTRLANMFRFSLDDGDGWTTLERELEHVKNYVAIEQLRNPGRFQAIFHIQPELLGANVLQLLLQPLVENAIRHGLNRREQKNGKLIVTAYLDNEDMIFTVEDNGPGPKPDKPGGIGIKNVERRLKLNFGEDYAIRFDHPAQGFKVKLRHPLIRKID